MEQQERHAIAKWAKALGVSTSGYYAWIKNRGKRAARDQEVRRIVKDLFHEGGQGS